MKDVAGLPALSYDRGMRIIGVDPGRTTGLCLTDGPRMVDAAEVTSSMDAWRWVEDRLPVDAVVMENFYGGSARVIREPLMIIGVISILCQFRDVPLVLQSPSALQSPIALAPVSSHPSRHVRSALTHIRYYLHKQVTVHARPSAAARS